MSNSRAPWLTVFLICGILVANPARAESVSDLYSNAEHTFIKGDINQALRLIKPLTQKYPDFSPGQLLYARILLRKGKTAHAAQVLHKIPASAINSSDAAFDYGLIYFSTKDWAGSLAGFSRVAHHAKDWMLAEFYKGVALYHLNRYGEADDSLRKAVSLPNEFAQTRNHLLQELNHFRDARGQFPPPPVMPVAIPKHNISSTPIIAHSQVHEANAPKKKDKDDTKPPPQIGFDVTIKPEIKFSDLNNTSDNFGYELDQSSTRTAIYGVDMAFHYKGTPWRGGAQPAFTLDLEETYNDVSVDGQAVKYYSTTSDQTVILAGAEKMTGLSGKFYETRMNVNGDIPLTSVFHASAGYEENLINRMTDDWIKYLYRKAFGAVNYTPADWEFIMSGYYEQWYLEPGVAYNTDTSGTFSSKKKWTDWDLKLTLSAIQSTPAVGVKPEGPMVVYSANVAATLNLEFGTSIVVTEGYADIADERHSNASIVEPPNNSEITDIVATGSQQTTSLALNLSPLDWLHGTMSYSYITASYATDDDAKLAALQQVTPEKSEIILLSIGVDKTF